MRKLVYVVLGILSFSCEKMPLGEDYVFVRHKNADMSVWVKGNKDSGVFVIYLHGGPGGSSFIDIQNDFFSGIENQYAMVYYDQRGSGNSIGKSDNNLFTLDQFVEDLDVIIEYINTRYSPHKIILLGHSWGGTLGTAYLLTGENQSKINAWIEVDGGHNLGKAAFEYSRDYVLRFADEKISNGSDKEKEDWTEVKNYYSDKQSWRSPDVVIRHSQYVTKANGYFYNQSNKEGLVGINQVLFSETDYLALLSQNYNVIKHMDVWHYDFTNRLNKISIPTLLLWGTSDGILPVQLAYEAKDAMDLNDDCFYIFQKSGHSPHYEETDLFNRKVNEFIADKVLF